MLLNCHIIANEGVFAKCIFIATRYLLKTICFPVTINVEWQFLTQTGQVNLSSAVWLRILLWQNLHSRKDLENVDWFIAPGCWWNCAMLIKKYIWKPECIYCIITWSLLLSALSQTLNSQDGLAKFTNGFIYTTYFSNIVSRA